MRNKILYLTPSLIIIYFSNLSDKNIINFPIYGLDLGIVSLTSCGKSVMYDLISCVNVIKANGAEKYISFNKMPFNDSWYYSDTSNGINQLRANKNDFTELNNYILSNGVTQCLFYQKR